MYKDIISYTFIHHRIRSVYVEHYYYLVNETGAFLSFLTFLLFHYFYYCFGIVHSDFH